MRSWLYTRGGLAVPVADVGGYSVVYADPCWSYDDSGTRGGVDHHYSTLSLEQLCALPVGALAAKDAALLLWATWPMLPEALAVIGAWGFKYKNCAFTWVKTTKEGRDAVGLGHWTRGNTEPCLLATRGKLKRIDRAVRQVVIDDSFTEETLFAQRGRHSEKPPEVRERIVRLLGDVPRIEMFARAATDGWDTWGDECPQDVQLIGEAS